MQKKFNSILFGISVLPALLIMPAMAEEITGRQVLNVADGTVLDGVSAEGIQNGSVGGVLYSNYELKIKNSTFTDNHSGAAAILYDNSLAAYKNGGTYSVTIEDSTFTGNSAGDFGAVAIFSPGSMVSGSTFSNNTATADYANLGDGAGALFLGSESQTVVINNTFTGNSSGTIGGAIATRPINYWLDTNYYYRGTNSSAGAKVDILSSVFENNTAGTRGGAFFNSFYNSETKDGYAYVDDSTFNNNGADLGGAIFVEGWTDAAGGNAKLWIDNSSFSSNIANTNGGAIYNESVLVVKDGTFTQNTASGNGGAIYNSGEMEISNSSFSGNVATGNSGAIAQNDGNAKLTLNNVSFDNNSADWGGAIVARGTVDITGGSFTGNTSSDGGGAIYLATLANKGHKLSINGTTFTNNSTAGVDVDGGGAIGSFSDLTLKNSTFAGNHVDGTASHGGGALFLGSVSTNDIQNVTFTSNTSATNGGAISMRYVDAGDNVGATLDITGSTFSGNKALDGLGGAIYNTFHNDKNDDGYVYVASSTFDGNSASNGGAIYNETSGTTDTVGGVLLVKDSTFTSNTTTGEGGAIYNAGILTLDGTNTFSGNTAGGAANDIYNLGTLTFAENSTTTMDGGIMGNGTLNIADGATLNIGTASIVQSELILNGTLNATLKNADEFAFFDISDSFDGSTGTLNFDLRAAGEYNVFQGEVLNNERVVVSSSVFDYEWNDTFDTITATMKSVEDIADENGLSNEAATTVANLVNSSSDKLNDFADAIQDKLASGDADAAVAVEHAHAAIHPETESVVQTVAMSVQNTVANLAAGRLMALNIGRNGGDANVTGGGVWAQGVYNKSKQNGAFDGYTRGVAGGADMTLNRVLTLGAGYSYAHSDISGTARDTEVDSSTIFAYGQYKPTDWFVNAMANYTMSDYSEHAVALGTDVDASYDVHSYGGQVMTGYDFAGGITPAVGVRYMHVTADEYKNSLGIKNKLQDSDYMTAMLETKWTHGFRVNRQFMIRPELRYAVKYDFMSDEQTATIVLPGVDSYVLDGTRLSRLGAEFGAGLGMKINGFDLSVNYEIELREGFTSQTGRARIRVEF